MATMLFPIVGCGGGSEKTVSELAEIRKDIAQVKGEIHELRRIVERRQAMDTGVRRMPGGMPSMTREEMEARRNKMMNMSPEERKKLMEERKARMEERRRQYEERRNAARNAANASAPKAAPAPTPALAPAPKAAPTPAPAPAPKSAPTPAPAPAK